MLRYLPFVLVLAVWIYAFIDCLNTPENEVRKLPKVAWVIIILLFGQVLLGPVVWFAVGRPRKNAPYGATKPAERRWVAPDDNPDFLKSLGEDRRPPKEEEPPAGPSPSGDTPETDRLRKPENRSDEGGRPGQEPGSAREGHDPSHREESRRKENGGGPDDPPATS
ncbi:PLDc_N domain-containing protein [Streptomyces sp. AJS327]|uniref:PLD nuclease N-terminal domain-containing protein n=1 Tax=Streptomyces sp. AJS327 TaxID=2545265 RepID=UPI0015DF3ADF|nr:PLD nuclease N-terminal domain-containing protein [Streptomyces sp. AJS327]MBA0053887.1 PLDc_N domain-containing protein [Streptomyces sp. AJS327]